jgi:hypothetical protein
VRWSGTTFQVDKRVPEVIYLTLARGLITFGGVWAYLHLGQRLQQLVDCIDLDT